jgi:hypothetical protein
MTDLQAEPSLRRSRHATDVRLRGRNMQSFYLVLRRSTMRPQAACNAGWKRGHITDYWLSSSPKSVMPPFLPPLFCPLFRPVDGYQKK